MERCASLSKYLSIESPCERGSQDEVTAHGHRLAHRHRSTRVLAPAAERAELLSDAFGSSRDAAHTEGGHHSDQGRETPSFGW